MKLFKKSIGVAVASLAVCASLSLASCSNNDGDVAMTNLDLLLSEKTESPLEGNLEVPYSVKIKDNEYVVKYTTNSDSATVSSSSETKKAEIVINQTGEEQSFTLTAKVENASKSWDFKIAAKDTSMIKTQAEIDAMEHHMDYNTWASASSGVDSLIQGYVTWAHDFSASYGNASVWLQDDNGGYYAYRIAISSQADYDEYLKIGSKIAIAGKTSPYNGWQEMGSGCKYYYISDAAPKTYEYKDVTASLSLVTADSADALKLQNQKVKVTGKVTSVPEYNNASMTMGISIGGQDYKVFYKSNYMGELPKDLATKLQVGYSIEVTGLTSVSNKALQICPVEADSLRILSTEVTDQDRVNGAVAEVKNQAISLEYYDSLSTPIELITTTTNECSVSYALSALENNGGTGTITLTDGNKFGVTVDYAKVTTAKLTATITKADAEAKTVEWEIKTITSDDVLKEITNEVKDQDVNLIFTETGARERLLKPSSPSSVKTLDVTYTVAQNDGFVTLGTIETTGQQYFDIKKIPSEQEGVIQVVLTATITYDGKTSTVNFTILLKKSFNDWEAYYYAVDDAKLGSITGIVTTVGNKSNADASKTKQNYAMIQTEHGPVYVFSNSIEKTAWNAKFVVGNKVTISSGKKDIYNGLHEYVVSDMKNVKVDKTGETVPAATDISEMVSTGASLEQLQGAKVKITGTAVVDGSKCYIKVGDKQILIYEDKSFATVDLEKNFTNGSTDCTVEGIIAWYKGAQIIPTQLIGFDAPEPTPDPEPVGNQIVFNLARTETVYANTAPEQNVTSLLTDSELLTIMALQNDYTKWTTYDNSGFVYFSKTDLRIYGSDANGNGSGLKITIASGYVIDTITIVADKPASMTVYAGETAVTGVENVFTINGSTVSFKQTLDEKDKTTVKISSIIVTYKQAA